MDVTFFETPADLRAWLAANGQAADELWVGFRKKGTGRPSVTWPEAVDEALCVGWIDGLRKRIDTESYKIRFTPRRKGSIWSAANVKRVGELTAQGRMQRGGLAAFEARDAARTNRYSFERAKVELAADQLTQFQADPSAWTYFQACPAYYRRAATWWVVSAKQSATRQRRLETLIADSAAGRRIRVMAGPAAG